MDRNDAQRQQTGTIRDQKGSMSVSIEKVPHILFSITDSDLSEELIGGFFYSAYVPLVHCVIRDETERLPQSLKLPDNLRFYFSCAELLIELQNRQNTVLNAQAQMLGIVKTLKAFCTHGCIFLFRLGLSSQAHPDTLYKTACALWPTDPEYLWFYPGPYHL